MTSGISLGSELEVPAWNLSVLSRPEKCDIAIFSFFGDKIRGGEKTRHQGEPRSPRLGRMRERTSAVWLGPKDSLS